MQLRWSRIGNGDNHCIRLDLAQELAVITAAHCDIPFLLAAGQQPGVDLTKAGDFHLGNAAETGVVHRGADPTETNQANPQLFFSHGG